MIFAGRRVAHVLAVVLVVILGAMLLLELLPGDPAVAILGETATQDQIDALHRQLGIDGPLAERYLTWVGDVFTLDLGRSATTGQRVLDAIEQRLPATLELAVLALLISLAVAIPVGLWAGSRADRVFDRLTRFGSSAVLSMPTFVLGIVLLYVLAVSMDWFPVTGWVPLSEDLGDNLRHVFLPAMTLGLHEAAILIRVLRSDVAQSMEEDFTLAARARGLTRRRVLVGHVLRPSSFSALTLAGLNFGRLLGGTVIVETIFAIPGLGQLALTAIRARDYTMLRGVVVFVAVGYVVINMVLDLIYPMLDPRLRTQRR